MDKQIKITFIVNPISGTSDKRHIIDLIPKYLDSSRFRWTIRYTEHKGHAAQFVGEAIEEGMDVVDAIANTDRDYNDKPYSPQVMKTVTVETFGVEYPEPEKAQPRRGWF